MGWRNSHDLALHASIVPAEGWSVAGALHPFRLDEKRDAWFGGFPGGVVRRDRTGSSGSHLGSEIDLHGRWKPKPFLDLWFGMALFLPGSYVDRTGVDPDLVWGFVQLTLTF